MAKFIIQEIPAGTIDSIRAGIQSNSGSLEPYKVNLTEEQKKDARTMAAGREGYVRLISQIANQHVNSLPREHTPTELAGRLVYDSKLEELRQALLKLSEIITETQLANSVDLMRLADDYGAALQISRNSNGSLDESMREVDEWNSRFSNPGNTQPKS